MKKALSFDDVLIVPIFSPIETRKSVDLSQSFFGYDLKLPIISANMDTITGSDMCKVMRESGAIGSLHRFMTIEDNVKEYMRSGFSIVSVGTNDFEFERAIALEEIGASCFIIDAAHGASMPVLKQYDKLRKKFKTNVSIIVGNFATSSSFDDFMQHSASIYPDMIKVGIGGGSMCTTRVVTGCGYPTLDSIRQFEYYGIPIIADGGIRNSGDIAKSLAAGANFVMIGQLLAGTDETPGKIIITSDEQMFKKYRGSASFSSYQVQNKVSDYRSPEGEETLIPMKGSAKTVLKNLEGGLRSSFSYVGASNIKEFKENSNLVEITNSGLIESMPHGKMP